MKWTTTVGAFLLAGHIVFGGGREALGDAFNKENTPHFQDFSSWAQYEGLPQKAEGRLVADTESGSLIYVTTQEVDETTGKINFNVAFGASSNILRGSVTIKILPDGTMTASAMSVREATEMDNRTDPSNLLHSIGATDLMETAAYKDLNAEWRFAEDKSVYAAVDMIAARGLAVPVSGGDFLCYAERVGLKPDDIVLDLDEVAKTAELSSCTPLANGIGICISTRYDDVGAHFNNGVRIFIKDGTEMDIAHAETQGHDFKSDRERTSYEHFQREQQGGDAYPKVDLDKLPKKMPGMDPLS